MISFPMGIKQKRNIIERLEFELFFTVISQSNTVVTAHRGFSSKSDVAKKESLSV